MSTPTRVTVSTRSGKRPDKTVDCYPMDTIYDILERAGLDPDRIQSVVIGPQYIRGFRTTYAWPGSTIEVFNV